MNQFLKRTISFILCVTMLIGVFPVSAMGMENAATPQTITEIIMDSGEQIEPTLGESDILEQPELGGEEISEEDTLEDILEDEETLPETSEEPTTEEQNNIKAMHWLQEYQQWALEQSSRSSLLRSTSVSPVNTFIYWGSGADSDILRFANGAWIQSPLPRITLNGEVAFCGEWNGANPSGSYEQIGTGSDTRIKQILANYDKSSKSDADYAAAQVAIWARLMNTTVATWGTCSGQSSANAIMNGTNDYSNVRYNYLQWSGGAQDLITYNTAEIPDLPENPDEEYPEDSYRIEVETDVVTTTEVKNRKTYSYSDAIGQITVRKHDQDGLSLDGALFNIRVDFTDGSFISVQNWEVDNGARLFTWNHPADNHDPATVTVTEVQAPRYYIMDSTPRTAVVAPTYTRVTHIETWTITVTTENTSSTVIEIESGSVVARSSSSSSASVESDPQVEEFADFIEGDRETTVTFVNTRITGNIEVLKKDANTGIPLAGATIHLYGDDLGEAGLVDKTLVTGADGIAYFNDLPPGTYIIEETQAPFGYNLNDEKQTVALQSGETIRKAN